MTQTITATSTALVTLYMAADNPTTITASGTLTDGLSVSYTGLAVINAGSIDAGSNRFGIKFLTAGSVTNQSGGTISGVYGIYAANAAVTVVNAGSIAGSFGGVDLVAGGSVTNQSGGAISGLDGIWGISAALTVVNAGSITGDGGEGIFLNAGGIVTNQSGGTISGADGIYGRNGAVTVVNRGSIAGSNRGVVLYGGGSVTNQSGGSISARSENGDGVLLLAGGSVTNQSGGTISGLLGIAGEGTIASTVVNAGSIAGSSDGGTGVYLVAGSVSNQSGGMISGLFGIWTSGGAVTVVNSGTITGSIDAVKFAAGSANRLVIDPNAVFSGTVTGGNTIGAAQVSTLELASAGSAGRLAGLGTQFVDFAQITVDAGAQWTLIGANSLAAGDTLIDAGTLTNAGRLSGALTLAAGGVLSNASTGAVTAPVGTAVYGATGGAATVVNAGVIAGAHTLGSDGIFLAAGGGITNQSGGTISGYHDGIVGYNAHATVVNAGSITGFSYGIFLAAGGGVTNQSGGTISGNRGIYAGTDAVTVVNAGSITGSFNGVYLVAGGSVTNQSGGTISGGAEGIYGRNSAVTVVNGGSIAGSSDRGVGVYLVAGGSVSNQSGGVISGFFGILTSGGAVTVVNAGTIASSHYAVQFATESANRLIADPGAVFTGSVKGGGGVLELASATSAGTLSGLGTSITNFSALQFDSGAAWTVSGNDGASGFGTIAITGFANGDTIDLSGFVASSDTFANNTLVLTDTAGAQATLAIAGAFTSGSFQLSTDGNGGTDVVICFCAGTMIGTPAGEVPVEKLKTGDMVLTAHNGPRAVTWIGQGKVLATRGPRSSATPVIVRKGALADNVPNRDLHVTKAHSLYIDDVLIPVEFLVNHRTILWDDRAQEVEIYHVELDGHDVLIANGAPAESYRDDGNRWLFQNANSGWHLPPQDPYAPVLTGGPVVDGVWRRLLDRAGPRALPPLTEDPDLHLVIDGARVDLEYRRGSLYGFRLPSSPKSVVIASRVGVPSGLGIARDQRSLGVALRQVAVRQGGKFMLFDADDDRLTVGFHAYEADCSLRWTDGRAELPAEAFARFDKGAEVMLRLGGTTQYPVEQASAARTAA